MCPHTHFECQQLPHRHQWIAWAFVNINEHEASASSMEKEANPTVSPGIHAVWTEHILAKRWAKKFLFSCSVRQTAFEISCPGLCLTCPRQAVQHIYQPCCSIRANAYLGRSRASCHLSAGALFLTVELVLHFLLYIILIFLLTIS